MHANETRADGNRVFELRIYHALPGKGLALESIATWASSPQAKGPNPREPLLNIDNQIVMA
jgi:hypothetical protein